ncbi:MAG: hypothetical protein AAGG55_16500 [Pseudomonadota bacterium]
MSVTDKQRRKEARTVAIQTWMARRSSRNQSFIDRLCRRVLDRALTLPPEKDFMRDDFCDNDEGFDAEELDRYQRGA